MLKIFRPRLLRLRYAALPRATSAPRKRPIASHAQTEASPAIEAKRMMGQNFAYRQRDAEEASPDSPRNEMRARYDGSAKRPPAISHDGAATNITFA